MKVAPIQVNAEVILGHQRFEGMADTAVRLMLRVPYMMGLYYSFQIYKTDKLPTLAMNGVAVWVNPSFWGQLDRDLRLTAIAHEIGHKMLMHPTRRGARDPILWNEAGDFVINLMLVESGFKPLEKLTINGKPWTWLYDEQYKGMTTEQVYDALLKEADDEQEAQGGDASGDDDGEDGDEGTPGKFRGSMGRDRLGPMRDLLDFGTDPEGNAYQDDGKPESAAEFEQRMRREVREAEMQAKMMGNVPGWMERVIGNAEHTEIKWDDVFLQWLKGMSTSDYSWNRMNRREFFKTGALAPDTYQPQMGGMLCLVDCSGSVDAATLCRFGRHLRDILEQVRPAWVEVVYFDTQPYPPYDRFERGEFDEDTSRLKPKGGGGTDFSWFAAHVEGMDEKPDVAICLTDMYGSFGKTVDLPFMWLSISSIKHAPYGDVIGIN